MVLISKQQKRMAYAYLLEEGVIVIKKVPLTTDTIGHALEETPGSGYAQPELDLHSEDPLVQEVCCSDLLLELVLLLRHQGRRQIPLPIPRYCCLIIIRAIGVSEQVLPKTFKAPPKKMGEEEPERGERRGYGERRGSMSG